VPNRVERRQGRGRGHQGIECFAGACAEGREGGVGWSAGPKKFVFWLFNDKLLYGQKSGIFEVRADRKGPSFVPV
jgi:hypothetical protein